MSIREQNQAERRERVVDAAMDLALQGGYDAVQMREVSAKADVALGTIYRYFVSKDEILTEGLVRWLEHMREEVRTNRPEGASAAEIVAKTMRMAAPVTAEATPLIRALLTAMSSPSPSVASRTRELHALMADIVKLGVGDSAPAGPELDGACRIMTHVWTSTIAQWVGGSASREEIANDLTVAAHLLLDRFAVGFDSTTGLEDGLDLPPVGADPIRVDPPSSAAIDSSAAVVRSE